MQCNVCDIFLDIRDMSQLDLEHKIEILIEIEGLQVGA